MKRIEVNIECPYCGYDHSFTTGDIIKNTGIIECELEDGGCGKKFAYTYTVKIETESMVCRLDWESMVCKQRREVK